MKYFSIRILALCILLPPLCYGISIQAITRYLTNQFSRDIEEISIGDVTPIFQGTTRLQDTIRENVDRYLANQQLLSWGVDANVLVTAGNQTILYPSVLGEMPSLFTQEEAAEIGRENYLLLNNGLMVTVGIEVPFYQGLSNIILGIFICLSMGILYGHYQRSVRREAHENEKINRKFDRLRVQKNANLSRLEALKNERESISEEMNRLKNTLENEKAKAKTNESDLFQEIIQLDEKLSKNLELQNQQQTEIEALREQIDAFEKDRQKKHKSKAKELETVAKRFNALYKNISFHDRAIQGFLDLTEDMRLKGEELIHRLNEAPDQVTIKRKVFSRKGRSSVLEVLFGYNGRLYFRKTQQTLEIVAMGTKNTQSKDLEFINNYSKRG